VFLIVIVIALDLSKPYRSLGEELGFSIYYCKADPPLKKKIEGGPFTMVDVTLVAKLHMSSFKHLRVTWL